MKTKLILSTGLAVIATLIISCKKNAPESTNKPGDYSATPTLPEYPDNYKASSNDNLAALGRVLFYDKNLSLNGSVACASCHQQAKAFCDNQQFSTGLQDKKTARNSPSIFAKTSKMFWDGRAASISDLVLRPVQNHVEMNFSNLKDLETKISQISYYPALFSKAYNGNSSVTQSKIKEALSEFLLNFTFSNNKFASFERGQASLNATESIGKELFFGKAQCSNCHHIENTQFSVNPFDSLNNNPGGNGYGSTSESHNIGLDEVYADNGIGDITHNTSDNGSFMIPALLNVEFTAPYMHDGRFKTLDEVVEHYNSGIKNHPNLDFRLRNEALMMNMTQQQLLQKFDANHNGVLEQSEFDSEAPIKLGLTANEKRSLVEFLKTLSDPGIFTDAKYSSPFVVK